MLELFPFLCFALVALLAYRERGARRDLEAARDLRHAIERERIEERQEARRERQELYQRIQAPEIAVSEHVRAERGPYVRREPIGADNDRAFTERGTEAEDG